MGYSIVDFATSLNVGRCKIRNTPNLIFLCGGPLSKKHAYKSARDYFNRHLKIHAPAVAARVKLAEEVNAWFRGGEFPDLLELENYLADLADLTILFVESPGSIAELGAFAASDILRPKTLPVLNTFYAPDRTFISDGPVQKLKNEDPRLVHYYEWDPKRLNSASNLNEFKEMAEALTKFLHARDKDRSKEQAFQKDKHGHALLMVANLLEVAGVATTTEIAQCLEVLGCDDFSHAQVKRYLSLLESMSFIKTAFRSNQAFYVVAIAESFIHFGYKSDAPKKEQRAIKTAVRAALDPVAKKILANSLGKKGTCRV